MKYNQPANYTDDLKAVVTKPSPRKDGNWVMEVEPKDENGNQLFTTANPGVVSISGVSANNGRLPVDVSGISLDISNTSISVNPDITDRADRILGRVISYYPELRRISTEPKPTTNPDGSALIKYSLLITIDTGVIEYWNGAEWKEMD